MTRTSTGIIINPNNYTVSIECEGEYDTPVTDTMYAPIAALVAEIAARYSLPLDRLHVIGYHEIDGDKACPGPQMDLDKIVALAAA